LLFFSAGNSFFTQPFKFSINFLGSALPPKSEASTADPRNLSQSAAKRQKGKKAKKDVNYSQIVFLVKVFLGAILLLLLS